LSWSDGKLLALSPSENVFATFLLQFEYSANEKLRGRRDLCGSADREFQHKRRGAIDNMPEIERHVELSEQFRCAVIESQMPSLMMRILVTVHHCRYWVHCAITCGTVN
jgi:hypothetical protein